MFWKNNTVHQSLITYVKFQFAKKLDSLPENTDVNDFVHFKYTPINSVTVERSFLMVNVLTIVHFENLKKISYCSMQFSR